MLRTGLAVTPVPDQRNRQRAYEKNYCNGKEFLVEPVVVDEKFNSLEEYESSSRICDCRTPDVSFSELLNKISDLRAQIRIRI